MRGLFHLNLYLGRVEMAVGKTFFEGLTRRLTGVLPGQRIKQARHSGLFGLVLHDRPPPFLFKPDGLFDQITRNLLHITADIADLGEFGRLNLYEGRIRKLGEAARNLGLAAPGGANHQDVFGRHFIPKLWRKLLPPPAIAHRHRHCALGVGLSNNVIVKCGNDGFGGEGLVHDADSRSSTVNWSLV